MYWKKIMHFSPIFSLFGAISPHILIGAHQWYVRHASFLLSRRKPTQHIIPNRSLDRYSAVRYRKDNSIAAFSLPDARTPPAVIAKVSTQKSPKKGLRQKDSLLTQSPCDAGQEVSRKTNELNPRRSGLHSSSSESLVEFYGSLHLFKTIVDERQTAIEEIHLRG